MASSTQQCELGAAPQQSEQQNKGTILGGSPEQKCPALIEQLEHRMLEKQKARSL